MNPIVSTVLLASMGIYSIAFVSLPESTQALQNAPTIVETTVQATHIPEEEKKPTEVKISQSSKPVKKQEIVAKVTHKELKGPKYTIINGIGGSRKLIPTITAKTKDERAKQFLASADMQETFPIWKDQGKKYKIDYSLPLCIAWADSNLGQALSTSYNLGNVGNNDRGDRVALGSWEQGIGAIFQTLNNQYMRGHSIIAGLSGEGRIRQGMNDCNATKRNQKCYASSTVVWDTNVRNCMSVIADKQITLDYRFRF